MKLLKLYAFFVLTVLEAALAAIPTDGAWTGHDWWDLEKGFEVVNGIAGAINYDNVREMIASTWNRNVSRTFPDTSPVVLRIKNVLRTHFESDPITSASNTAPSAEDYWNYLFPFANSFYTFDSFLNAASRFPYFCNDSDVRGEVTQDDMCMYELTLFFTHVSIETGAYFPTPDP